MNAILDVLFTAGQAASAALVLYGGYLVLSPGLGRNVAADATWRVRASRAPSPLA